MDNQHKQIEGYRDLSQAELNAMNEWKALEATVAERLQKLEGIIQDSAGSRWATMARTNLETGFMYAIKAIAQPTNGLGRK